MLALLIIAYFVPAVCAVAVLIAVTLSSKALTLQLQASRFLAVAALLQDPILN